jgi:hypothetical protein
MRLKENKGKKKGDHKMFHVQNFAQNVHIVFLDDFRHD